MSVWKVDTSRDPRPVGCSVDHDWCDDRTDVLAGDGWPRSLSSGTGFLFWMDANDRHSETVAG